ncbi:MAG: CPXCG motif-containing cysteine-rich protein, partial [Gammaproteobacteria bacterium]|nr:CPXCG motif-containing cysteine-rich protein [Gammaproteobacteria bacterium]
MEQETHSITCPHCWQILEILIDPSAGDQEYTEDCQVCCHPM